MLEPIMRKIKKAFGRDLEHTCASKGTFSGRLHETVTDVFLELALGHSGV